MVYNWAGIVFKKGKDYGANEGGMKSSGDRNSEANQTVLNLYNNHPFVAKYFEEPFLNDAVGVLDMKLRRLKYNRKRPKWHTYFEPDKNQVI